MMRLALSFQNGRTATQRRAIRVGNRRAVLARHIDGGITMAKAAMKLGGAKIAPPKNFSPKISEQEAAAEFSAVILPFSSGQLAQATGRSKETAKCWKAGRAFPNGTSLKALEAEFPQIRSWTNRRWGIHDSPERLTNGFALLEQVMSSNTAEGRAMRARLEQLIAEGGRGR